MTEYSKVIRNRYTSTGAAQFINLPFLPSRFEWKNLTQWAVTTDHKVKDGYHTNADAAGVAYCHTANGATTEPNTLSAGAVTLITAGTYQYGPTLTISGIVAATGVVTTTTPHGLSVGDAVQLYGTLGELQIAGIPTSVTAVGSPTTFTIGNIPTAGFAADATAGFCKKILFPDLYIPFVDIITGVTQAASAVITVSVNHSFVVGQLVGFSFPQPFPGVWGMNQLDTAAFLQLTGLNQQAFVTAVTTNSITVNIDTTGFTAFAFPTSAQAGLGGLQFPQVFPIGDANTGYSGPVVPFPQTIPGAFANNTRQGVLLGTGDGTSVIQVASDVIEYTAFLDDSF